jgi:hypothetical protein
VDSSPKKFLMHFSCNAHFWELFLIASIGFFVGIKLLKDENVENWYIIRLTGNNSFNFSFFDGFE